MAVDPEWLNPYANIGSQSRPRLLATHRAKLLNNQEIIVFLQENWILTSGQLVIKKLVREQKQPATEVCQLQRLNQRGQ